MTSFQVNGSKWPYHYWPLAKKVACIDHGQVWSLIGAFPEWNTDLQPAERLSCGFTSYSTQNRSFRRRFPKPVSWLGMKKLNLTQQKHAFTNQKKCTTTQNVHKKSQIWLPFTTSGLEMWRKKDNWGSIPYRQTNNIFKLRLKTFLFSQALSSFSAH